MLEFEEPKRGELHLNCRTTIWLSSINQSLTYSGMLEGYPNSELNRRLVEGIQERLEKRSQWKPFLIEPEEREVPNRSTVAKKRPWVELPKVQCTAWFRSNSLGEFGSRLAIIWFQDDFAFPIDPKVENKIRSMVWSRHAEPLDDF